MNVSVYRNLNKYRWVMTKKSTQIKIKLSTPLKSLGGGKIEHFKNDGDYTCQDQLSNCCR